MSMVSRMKAAWSSFVKNNIITDDPYQEEVSFETLAAGFHSAPKSSMHTIQGRFLEFHAMNPEVYENLVELAYQAQEAGLKTYGISGLFERLRWHYNVDVRTDSYKLNNSYRANYARLIMEQEPGLAGFFNLREQTAA